MRKKERMVLCLGFKYERKQDKTAATEKHAIGT
jgi:hypothetical protein